VWKGICRSTSSVLVPSVHRAAIWQDNRNVQRKWDAELVYFNYSWAWVGPYWIQSVWHYASENTITNTSQCCHAPKKLTPCKNMHFNITFLIYCLRQSHLYLNVVLYNKFLSKSCYKTANIPQWYAIVLPLALMNAKIHETYDQILGFLDVENTEFPLFFILHDSLSRCCIYCIRTSNVGTNNKFKYCVKFMVLKDSYYGD
jgi:hypothetical protein